MASPRSGARLALFSAPPAADRPIRQIGPDEVRVRTVGRDAWTRRVCSVVDEGVASRLLVGETINQAGGWSSYPPHKHDSEVAGREVPMEEIYHYCVRPPGGFGLQMVYTAPDVPYPFAHTYRVGDGDTVVIPRGYHPVVAAGGYQIAYLWAISGERVEGGAWSDDPAHAWLGG
jgi:5-deoxy-glucuronate isomerase